MGKHQINAALLTFALVIAACSQNDGAADTNSSASTAAQVQAPPAKPSAPAAPESAVGNNVVPNRVSTGGAAQHEFSVVNNMGRTVTRLVSSGANEDDWGIDMLAMQTRPNGATGRVSVGRSDGQCLWDLRATLEGGETRDWRGLNLCELSSVTLTPA
jgi:hypothetical protein